MDKNNRMKMESFFDFQNSFSLQNSKQYHNRFKFYVQHAVSTNWTQKKVLMFSSQECQLSKRQRTNSTQNQTAREVCFHPMKECMDTNILTTAEWLYIRKTLWTSLLLVLGARTRSLGTLDGSL
uniref:Uncharacterized protein n=1 Tax=Micrurus lemniscatus lemniscatus TaxID=129467 RepID=A0A2D4IWK7_MICLE